MVFDGFAKGREGAVGYDAGEPAVIPNGQQRRGRSHGDTPEKLRLPRRLHENELACRPHILGFENPKGRVGAIALAVISEIEKQDAVSALVRFSGACQQFESRTIQSMTKDNDRKAGFPGAPPS